MIYALLLTAAIGQVRPLPKYVQEMDKEEYAVWAEWQNHHTLNYKRDRDYEPEHIDVLRTTRSGNMRSTGRGYNSAHTDKYSGRRRNFSGRTGSRSVNLETSTYIKRYPNPHYVPPRGRMLYNPFVKPVDGVGAPDWDNLMVPTKDGVVPMSTVIPNRPVSLEKLYEQLMKGN